MIRKLLGWRRSGFSPHNAVRIGPHDTEVRRAVAEYFLRSPFSLGKMEYQATTGTITYYLSKMHPILKRNFEMYSATDWLAALTAHIPIAGEHLVRVLRRVQQRESRQVPAGSGRGATAIEPFTEVSASAAKRAWARLIKQLYAADPLTCPRCTGPMRLIAFIGEPEVIEEILPHRGLWPAHVHSPPAGAPVAVFPAPGRVAA